MSEQTIMVAVLFLLLFVGLIAYFSMRIKNGYRLTLRQIPAFAVMRRLMAETVESGRKLHLSVGLGGIANETTADTLAGISVLEAVTTHSAKTGEPAIITMADPMVWLLSQNVARATHKKIPANIIKTAQDIRWIAPQSAAYAAGVMNILNDEEVNANIMVGNLGDEYLLMGETAAHNKIEQVGGASNPNTLPFIYASTRNILLGEEIYAAGAYLQKIPAHLASVLTQDVVRWLVVLLILGSIAINSVR